MANTTSAKKATRKIEQRSRVNQARRSRMRSTVRTVEEAIDAGDKEAATQALVSAQPELMRAASKGIIHKKKASRKISRLSQRIKTIGA